MTRCNNCGTNNLDGSDYCDECGMKLDVIPPPHNRVDQNAPIFKPPSAVESEPLKPSTMEGPFPSPPSFTTSTSMPKPAIPARDRKPGSRSAGQNGHSDRSGAGLPRNGGPEPEQPGRNNNQTYVLASSMPTDPLEEEKNEAEKAGTPPAKARLIVERGGRVGREFSIT